MADVKRRYDSARRRDAAARTRARMLGAARRQFAERGYAATTVEAIAEAAGVAPQTFYKAFGSKRGVLFALLDGMPAAADPATLASALASAPDSGRQLALLVDYRLRLYAGSFDVLTAVRAASAQDPDVAAVWREGEDRRRRNHQKLLSSWHARGDLRSGLTRRQADDILWALTGPDVYRLFVVERRWSRERFRAWLVDLLAAELLGTGSGGKERERRDSNPRPPA
jgi:AcrR family transcriptional regulator